MLNKTNISQSIILMGPCGVGKSLISSTLGQKTNLPVVDIDDLIALVADEIDGKLSPDPRQQGLFVA